MQHPQVEGRTPDYKLTYFNVKGRGEGARLLFHYAGVPFEDVRIEKEQWPEMKKTMPFGQLPVLEVDGNVLAQSAAIYRFLGRELGLIPKCPFETAEVDSIFEAHRDFHDEIRPFTTVAFGFKEGDKEQLIKDLVFPARDKYFVAMEKFLEKSGGEYLVGKSVTWADIVISDALDTLHEFVPTLFDGHAAVKKFVDHIREIPNIKKYLSQRPESKF